MLSAYKQGYSWLYDVVRPALQGQAVDQITIKFAEIGPPSGWKQQGMYAPTRWLLEIYPIDEILASELKIDLQKDKVRDGADRLAGLRSDRRPGPAARRCFTATFDPAIVERPFFDRFPDYEHVRVTTGWIKATVAGKVAADERIATDPERFWDRFQSKTLPALYDHVMALGNGKPRPEDAPFFGELTVDLTLSEPEYRLPVDQEQISSMEALHEEIYFNTIHFFDVMGRFTRGAGLAVSRSRDSVDASEGRRQGRAREDHRHRFRCRRVRPSSSSTPSATARPAWRGSTSRRSPSIGRRRWRPSVRAGQDGIERLDLRVKVDTEKDERDALIKRTADERVDRTMLSAEQVTAVFANLNRLRTAGAYRDALAYHDLGSVRVTVGWEHESKPGTEVVATLEPNGAPAPFPDIKKYPRDATLAMGHADSAARGLRHPREDVGVQGSDASTRSARAISAKTSGRWT